MVNEKELIVNILKIPNQVTDIETIDLKKEVKPEVIKKIKQDQKNWLLITHREFDPNKTKRLM